MIAVKIFMAFSVLAYMIIFSACTNTLFLYSKPKVDHNSGWKWYEVCGYECKPMVDIFEKDGIKIRIESFNYKSTFTIYFAFIASKIEQVTFNPGKTFVTLPDGRTIRGKARRPGYTKEEYATLERMNRDYLGFLRAAQPLIGDLALDLPYGKKEFAIDVSFFFDATPPHPSEEFELHIDGLINNGQKVDVPVIKFGPAVRDSGHGIPIGG